MGTNFITWFRTWIPIGYCYICLCSALEKNNSAFHSSHFFPAQLLMMEMTFFTTLSHQCRPNLAHLSIYQVECSFNSPLVQCCLYCTLRLVSLLVHLWWKPLPRSLSFSMTVNDRSDMRSLLVMLTYVQRVVNGKLFKVVLSVRLT